MYGSRFRPVLWFRVEEGRAQVGMNMCIYAGYT